MKERKPFDPDPDIRFPDSNTSDSNTADSNTSDSNTSDSRSISTGSLSRALFGWVALVTVNIIFVPGMLTTLWTSHFLSFTKLDLEPKGQLARFISGNMETFDVAALLSAVLLATTSLIRLGKGDWKPPMVRVVAIALAPVVIEIMAHSVQNGTTNDLELVRVHSVALLVLIVCLPPLSSLFDLWRIKNPRVKKPSGSQLAPSKTLEAHKERARSGSAHQND